MRIHATAEEVAALPRWARDFLDAAWAPADTNGQRVALGYFENIETIGRQLAFELDSAWQNPNVSARHITLALVDPPQFTMSTFWKDRTAEIAYGLALAWNSRGTLADCMICQKLIQPSKGRVARTCSEACRVELHRRNKEA